MPAPGFLTDAALTTALESAMSVAPGTLGSGDSAHWLTIVEQANGSAYQDILGALLQRGLSLTQIDTWHRGIEFQRDLGLFWALVRGAGLHGFDDTYIKPLDRRKELETVALIDAVGAPLVPPDPPLEGQVARGVMSSETDLFRLDPCDPRRGRVTRW